MYRYVCRNKEFVETRATSNRARRLGIFYSVVKACSVHYVDLCVMKMRICCWESVWIRWLINLCEMYEWVGEWTICNDIISSVAFGWILVCLFNFITLSMYVVAIYEVLTLKIDHWSRFHGLFSWLMNRLTDRIETFLHVINNLTEVLQEFLEFCELSFENLQCIQLKSHI